MAELIITADGSHTIFVPELNEHYHSVNGAVQESNHVFIKAGYDFCKADPLRIFEVGFGTGLNALLTASRCLTEKREVIYTTIEKYPIGQDLVYALNYKTFIGENERELFDSIHSAPWGEYIQINEFFCLKKINGDLITHSPAGKHDLIYFDAFGPDKQPSMWSREIFKKVADITDNKGILTTYSAKGEVKRILKENGFVVTLLPGPPGKRQMIRAVKN